jgi:hypothetical protein
LKYLGARLEYLGFALFNLSRIVISTAAARFRNKSDTRSPNFLIDHWAEVNGTDEFRGYRPIYVAPSKRMMAMQMSSEVVSLLEGEMEI